MIPYYSTEVVSAKSASNSEVKFKFWTEKTELKSCLIKFHQSAIGQLGGLQPPPLLIVRGDPCPVVGCYDDDDDDDDVDDDNDDC
ncbi:jg1097 [Pararge aegeria aegeria]|uniref:Jg1097 protein n=1 Tax=Pararge aegeria aegeria TaxID=348720 RepID=A0A8S4QT51_9NEOP|nr:jg1097 [Pararge aegeria aegeria]